MLSFMAVMFQVEVFWVVTPCSDVAGYQRFRGPCCIHLQGEDGSSMVPQIVGTLPRHYTASQPRRPLLDGVS